MAKIPFNTKKRVNRYRLPKQRAKLRKLEEEREIFRELREGKWSHGFAIVEVDGNRFRVHNHQIIGGEVF